MKIEELNKNLREGYKVENLTTEEQVIVKSMLMVLDTVDIDVFKYDKTKVLDMIRFQVATETVDDIRNRIILYICENIVSMIDENDDAYE